MGESSGKEIDTSIQKVEVSVNQESSGGFGYAKLNDTNYHMWKKMIIAHLCGLNKIDYINGTLLTPD